MAELALEALKSARSLLDDGVLLFERGRLPRAFALASLAADELGKHVLVTSFYAVREETDEEWRKFWRRFRHHESKLGDALWGAWAGDLLTDSPPPNIREFHERRLSATYVDVAADGSIRTPEREINTQHVEEALEVISKELKFCEQAMTGATPEAFGRHLEAMRSSKIGDDFRASLADVGTVGATGFVIALRAGMKADDALAFARFADDHLGAPAQPDGTAND